MKWYHKLYRKYLKLTRPRFPIHPIPTASIGSGSGAWTIPIGLLDQQSVCYLAGAGENISFDVGLANQYHCAIFIFDPTPRAIQHFDTLSQQVVEGQSPTLESYQAPYSISQEAFSNITFLPVGMWDQEEQLKFYQPKNPDHVSHSAVNLQKTDDYFLADVKPLSQIMTELNHHKLDLLKIDIEGAEYKVIESIIQDKLAIDCLCVEYDEAYNPLDMSYQKRISASVKSLLQLGYVIIDADSYHNYTFLKKEKYDALINS